MKAIVVSPLPAALPTPFARRIPLAPRGRQVISTSNPPSSCIRAPQPSSPSTSPGKVLQAVPVKLTTQPSANGAYLWPISSH